jgi:hypothetical protein
MKSILRPMLILIVISLLIFLAVSFSRIGYAQATQSGTANFANGAFTLQATATAPAETDRSEIGSTDWITVMSFGIVAIVIIPILIKRKSWSKD